MQLSLTNGALLHRVSIGGQATELIGVLQYAQHAELLANVLAEQDAKLKLGDSIYTITSTYSGDMTAVRPTPVPAQ